MQLKPTRRKNRLETLVKGNVPVGILDYLKGDLAVVLGDRPKQTRDEIQQELGDFFNDPETRKRMSTPILDEGP